ncbi:MAG: helicase [Deltaproteobacteria bacterium]|nr:helicase [Deltaproteobacteria bacterium]
MVLDGGQPHSILSALLGPTNTGKTHRAVERMLEHPTGMIGLPLRLLAREIYDRVTTRVGERAVALVTGEEKRIPPRPRYWISTVEAMPIEREVDFIAVDEIQLAAHSQRGHVFTDRLLRARGRQETWFMGSDTMRPMMAELVPTATVRRHPRLSRLRAAGKLGLSALPPRSAIVAFSAAEVYELAERVRRRRGGAAVVLGALSPRTRNAQVAMYQAGEVDFLVATDAVGMGLNMDVDHVAFAALRKFDGFRVRPLSSAELAQIAGRAGRHTRDGTFGTLSPLELPPDVAFAIESHRFAPVRRVMWRNSDLDTSSLEALSASLKQRPSRQVLSMVEKADDAAVLSLLVEREAVVKRARNADTVSLLWDVCRIPDFRKLLVEHHANLLEEIFVQLAGPQGRIEPDFMHKRISRLENDSGDIDTLMMRMDFIRTWSYIAHHSAWVQDAKAWQERTQQAEDRLSQALHLRLVERFVERSGRRSRARRAKPRGRQQRPEPRVEQDRRAGGPFEQLAALRDSLRDAEADAPMVSDAWVDELVEAAHDRFQIDLDGRIWLDGGAELARLSGGVDVLHPEVRLTLARDVGAGGLSRILRRLRAWTRDMVDETLGPLRDGSTDRLSASGRGLLYQLQRQLGTVAVGDSRGQLQELTREDRELLEGLGVTVGRRFVYLPALLEPPVVRQRMALCAAQYDKRLLASEPTAMAPAFPTRRGIDGTLYRAVGYPAFGPLAIRVDVIERVDERLDELAKTGAFEAPAELGEWMSCTPDELAQVVVALGYHHTEEGYLRPHKPRGRKRRRRRGRR